MPPQSEYRESGGLEIAPSKGQMQLPYDLPAETPGIREAPALPRNDHDAVWALGLAVAAIPMLYFLGMGLIVAVVSLMLVRTARRNIARSGGTLGGEGLVSTAVTLDLACFGLFAIMVVVAVLLY
ncbi:MAG: hypothetical protein ACRDN9_02595 [Streptosporangiaceae bacterium]